MPRIKYLKDHLCDKFQIFKGKIDDTCEVKPVFDALF